MLQKKWILEMRRWKRSKEPASWIGHNLHFTPTICRIFFTWFTVTTGTFFRTRGGAYECDPLKPLQRHPRKSVNRVRSMALMLKISVPREIQCICVYQARRKKNARRGRFYEAKLCAVRAMQSNAVRGTAKDQNVDRVSRRKCFLVRGEIALL